MKSLKTRTVTILLFLVGLTNLLLVWPFSPAVAQSPSVCPVCHKTVMPNQAVTACNHVYHKLCFKCSVCKVALNLNNYVCSNGRLYCKKDDPAAKHKNTLRRSDR